MELTIDQILSYLECPASYEFKYKTNAPCEESETVKYNRAIHKTIDFYYYNLMGGITPSPKRMKDKWASLWNEAKVGGLDTSEFLLKERGYKQPKIIDKRVSQGAEAIHNFVTSASDRQEVIIAVNHEFRVPIGGVTVVGNFELIREIVDKSSPKRFIEIVDFKAGTSSNDLFHVNNDLRLTIMSYAFRNIFQGKEDRIVVDYLKNNTQIITKRGDKDFRRMTAIVEAVALGIGSIKPYPRQGIQCKACPFKEICNITNF